MAWPKRFAFLFVLFWIAGSMGFIFFYSRQLQKQPLPELGTVPAFELTDSGGKIFSSAALEGKVWVADFIFSSCGGPCPMMSAEMARFDRKLSDFPELRLVSFSVDPEHDTPQRLAAYAAQYEANPMRWHFLTGDREAIYGLALQHFRLAAGTAETPDAGHMILHSTKFVLVDRRMRIRGYYDSLEPPQLKKLALDARRLAQGLASDAAAA